MAVQEEQKSNKFVYRRLLHNRAFLLLSSGQAISTAGDAFFNLAVLWVIYTQSGSAFQTAIIQVIWHLSNILLSPIAGVMADRGNRRLIMLIANLLSAGIVGLLAAFIHVPEPSFALIVFATVFMLNSFNTFLSPAQFVTILDVVDRDLTTTTLGVFSTIKDVSMLIGSSAAGVVIAIAGASWAIIADTFSFLLAALAVAIVPLPNIKKSPDAAISQKQHSLLKDLIDGLKAIKGHPVIQGLMWLVVLLNVTSFLGPLVPALVSKQLHSGAEAYGILQAVSIIGAIIGGLLAGWFEHRFGTGILFITGCVISGACIVGMSISPILAITGVLEFFSSFSMTVSSISVAALLPLLIPESYRGRLRGIIAGLSVIAIPISALAGGWLADILGVAPLFAIGGFWTLGIAVAAWIIRPVRTARIESVAGEPQHAIDNVL